MPRCFLTVLIRVSKIIHGRPVQFSGEENSTASTVNPILFPLLSVRVIDVEALAGAAASAGPILEHYAFIENLLDAARADYLIGSGLFHGPLANPEIKL